MFRLLLIVVTLGVQIACSRDRVNTDQAPNKKAVWNAKISKFSSCQEISSYLESYVSSSPAENISSEHFSPQVKGVHEGDILQTHPKYYFFARPGSIEIVERSSLRQFRSLPVRIGTQYSIIYADKKLIAIVSESTKTWTYVFNEDKDFSLISEVLFTGGLVDYRYLNKHLVLVTSQSYLDPKSMSDCSEIYRPNFENGSAGMTSIYKISTKDSLKVEDSLMLWGSADFFYMTTDELFIFQKQNIWGQRESNFRVINWASGTLSFNQAELFPEILKDRTAVSVKKENLMLASTYTSQGQLNNHIVSYQRNADGIYELRSSSADFGQNEDIRAVHFMDDLAYVVTFEKTDPLFIINVKDPDNIKIISELKSPGFSTQLYLANPQILLGIGYDTNSDEGFSWFGGLKLSLFNIANLSDPKETSILKYGDRGSYSDAIFDFKAIYQYSNQSKFSIPIVHLEKDKKNDSGSPWEMGNQHIFSGVVLLQVQGERLVEVGRLTHQKFREPICGINSYLPLGWWTQKVSALDIQRSFETEDDCLDTFSRFGVMRHCGSGGVGGTGGQMTKALEFMNNQSLCQR